MGPGRLFGIVEESLVVRKKQQIVMAETVGTRVLNTKTVLSLSGKESTIAVTPTERENSMFPSFTQTCGM